MKGFIRQAALGTSLGALIALAGCTHYRELVDPCWPERYNYEARQSVRAAFNAQAANGHALDQTIWNQYFEPGKAKLVKVGEEHLKYLARRRPSPDPRVYVQFAYDAQGGDPKVLNEQRVQAVQEYLAGIAGNRNMPGTFDVVIADAPEPGLRARPAPSLYVTPASALQAQPGATVGAGPPGTSQQATAQQAPGTTQAPAGQQPRY